MANSITSSFFKRQEFFLACLVIVLCIMISSVNKDFFSIDNVLDIVSNYSMLGILACGLVIVLISGGIDISFPATTATCQYLMGIYMLNHHVGFISIFAVSIVVGIVLGLINGLIIYYTKVPSIIITIATMNIFYGFLIYFSDGDWLYNFPEWFMDGINFIPIQVQGYTDYLLTLPIIAVVGVFVFSYIFMNKTRLGRQIFAVGSNAESAQRLGISIRKVYLYVYGYMGALSGIAAVSQAQIAQSVAPNSMFGYELTVLAAVVIGGASIQGGKGTILGTLLGVILIAIIDNGLTLLGVSSYWHSVITGLIIIISIIVTAMHNKKSRSLV